MVSYPENLSQHLTNALAQDTRGFYLNKVDEQVEQFNVLVNAELNRPYVMEPTISVQEIVSHFQVHLYASEMLTRTEGP